MAYTATTINTLNATQIQTAEASRTTKVTAYSARTNTYISNANTLQTTAIDRITLSSTTGITDLNTALTTVKTTAETLQTDQLSALRKFLKQRLSVKDKTLIMTDNVINVII